MEKERDVVARDVHVALVDFCSPGHRVEVFDLRTIGIVLDDAVRVFVTDAEDFVERLSVGKLDYGEVEFAAADEVEDFALVESTVGVGGDGRPDKSDLNGRVGVFDGTGETMVAAPAYGRGEEDEEFIALSDLDRLFRRDVVGRGVQELRAFQHSCGIGEPDGVPVRLDLAGSGPAGAGTAVKILERGRIEKQRF